MHSADTNDTFFLAVNQIGDSVIKFKSVVTF